MAHLLFCTVLLYFLIFTNEVLSLGNVIVRGLEPDDTLLPERRLRAAKRGNELGARDVKGCLKYDHNLHYLDGKYKSSLLIVTDVCHESGYSWVDFSIRRQIGYAI